MKYALFFLILFQLSAQAQTRDTLTLKDCDCRKYDERFQICSIMMFRGEVIKFDASATVVSHKLISPWEFRRIDLRYYESPYGKVRTTTWSKLDGDSFFFATYVFFIEIKKA